MSEELNEYEKQQIAERRRLARIDAEEVAAVEAKRQEDAIAAGVHSMNRMQFESFKKAEFRKTEARKAEAVKAAQKGH